MKLENLNEVTRELTKLKTCLKDSVIYDRSSDLNVEFSDNAIFLNSRYNNCEFAICITRTDGNNLEEIYFRTDEVQEISIKIANGQPNINNDKMRAHFLLIPMKEDLPESLHLFKADNLEIGVNIADIQDVNKSIKCYAIPYTFSKYGHKEI